MKTNTYSKKQFFYLKLFHLNNYCFDISFQEFDISIAFFENHECTIKFFCSYKNSRVSTFDIDIIVSKEDFERLFDLGT